MLIGEAVTFRQHPASRQIFQDISSERIQLERCLQDSARQLSRGSGELVLP